MADGLPDKFDAILFFSFLSLSNSSKYKLSYNQFLDSIQILFYFANFAKKCFTNRTKNMLLFLQLNEE